VSDKATVQAGSPWGPLRSSLLIGGALLAIAILGVVAVTIGGAGHTTAKRTAKTGASPGSVVVAAPPATTTYANSGSPKSRSAGQAAPGQRAANAKQPRIAVPGAGAGVSGKAVAVAEVRDPEEAKSFPLPASVHHRRASSPSVVGEAAVAPGAASDAEIRKELGEEKRAEAQARAAQQRALTPVAGGFSVGGDGTIPIPSGVPEAVQRVIAGGNAIADFPYIWGGGHASFIANGYDCSGSVSYALAAGGLLSSPLVSGDLANWGEAGLGHWITVYANPGHTFMDVDGMWFDTAGRSGPYASRWLVSTPPLAGYAVRHPPGL
jgi:cell wall-associated NlpC family hydrolase